MATLLEEEAREMAHKCWRIFGCKDERMAVPSCKYEIVRRVGVAAAKYRAMQIRDQFDFHILSVNKGWADERRRQVYDA